MVAPGALEVDGPGGHLLAGPALPGDEDGRVRRGHLLDEDVDLLHRPALADHLLEAVAVLEVPLEEDVLLLEAPGGQSPADDDLQLLDVEGLDDVVEGPGLQGLDGLGDAAVGRDQDDRQVGQVLPGVAEDVHAVGAGHLDVGDDEIDLLLGQDLEAAGGRQGGLDGVAFFLEDDREQVEEALFVVDDQDRFHGLSPQRPRGLAQGQRDQDLGPLVELGADVDPSVVVVDDLADDRQAQSPAALEARVEGLEEVAPCPLRSCPGPCRRRRCGRPSSGARGNRAAAGRRRAWP